MPVRMPYASSKPDIVFSLSIISMSWLQQIVDRSLFAFCNCITKSKSDIYIQDMTDTQFNQIRADTESADYLICNNISPVISRPTTSFSFRSNMSPRVSAWLMNAGVMIWLPWPWICKPSWLAFNTAFRSAAFFAFDKSGKLRQPNQRSRIWTINNIESARFIMIRHISPTLERLLHWFNMIDSHLQNEQSIRCCTFTEVKSKF